MLSIIISSYQENYYNALEKNIAETIGLPYEIIKIKNVGEMGICEAYNKGALKAQYDYLLFVHEDVIIQTYNWGELLINNLKDKTSGVIGLAGSSYVPSAPSSWSINDNKYIFCNVNNKEINSIKSIPYEKVFAIDGVFMAVKKSVYNEFLFDENIKGFHGYDTDFSLRVATKYNNFVANDIYIKHFSKGNPDKAWFDNNIQIRKKIKYKFNQNFDENLETQLFHIFLRLYYTYYQCTFDSILQTLQFMPNKISFKNKYPIIKGYLYYFFKNK